MAIGLVLAIWAVATQAASAREPVAEIPYRFDYDGWITVQARVNGEGPYDFIVDTGATLSVVFSNLESDHIFPEIGGEPRRILGLIEANDLPPRYIGAIDVSGQRLDDFTSVVIDDWAPPRRTPQGVLGLDFLSRYTVFIDPATATIKLYADGRPDIVDAKGWSSVRMRDKTFIKDTNPLYVVRARIRSRTYPFILDLGASGTVVNFSAVDDMLSSRRINLGAQATSIRRPKVQDLFGNEHRSRFVRIQRMKIGGVSWRNKTVSVYNSGVFNELGISNMPYGLLGADMFRDRQLVLDFPKKRMHLGERVRRHQQPARINPPPPTATQE